MKILFIIKVPISVSTTTLSSSKLSTSSTPEILSFSRFSSKIFWTSGLDIFLSSIIIYPSSLKLYWYLCMYYIKNVKLINFSFINLFLKKKPSYNWQTFLFITFVWFYVFSIIIWFYTFLRSSLETCSYRYNLYYCRIVPNWISPHPLSSPQLRFNNFTIDFNFPCSQASLASVRLFINLDTLNIYLSSLQILLNQGSTIKIKLQKAPEVQEALLNINKQKHFVIYQFF